MTQGTVPCVKTFGTAVELQRIALHTRRQTEIRIFGKDNTVSVSSGYAGALCPTVREFTVVIGIGIVGGSSSEVTIYQKVCTIRHRTCFHLRTGEVDRGMQKIPRRFELAGGEVIYQIAFAENNYGKLFRS